MKAVVMAGGEGSRLRPLTIARPKPMVPLVNKPCIEHILELLKKHGITEVVITVQYLAAAIQDHFGDGSSLGMKIVYSVEETPLGTAGSVKLAQDYLKDTFLVISGDALTDINLTEVINFHKERRALATLTLYRVPNPLEYGVIITNEEGRIQQFLEKPSWGEVFSDTVNTGIYVLEPEIFEHYASGEPVDFSQQVFPEILKQGGPLFGYVAGGYWCDIGNHQEYMRANADILREKVAVAPIGKHIGGGIWCADDEVEIAPDAQLFGPIYLGKDVKIKGGVVIHGPTVIRDYTIVDSGAHIDRCIIWRDSYIGERAELRGAIIGKQCSIKSKAMIFEGAVIGDGTIVSDSAIIQPNVKIWPNKEIETGATISSSIIWGSQGRRVLFGRYGITGLVNIDLTPEFVAKLGAGYGATLPKGAVVTMTRDPHRSARMIKRAMISGLPSAGVNVLDLKTAPIPVARYITRIGHAVGGVHVRLSPYDSRVVDIKFFDSRGLDIDKATERRIENTFFREDFRRVYLDEIGTITDAPQLVDRYIEGFSKALDLKKIQSAGSLHTLVIDYANAPAAGILPIVLNQFGFDAVTLNAAVQESKLSSTPEEFDLAMRQLGSISAALHAGIGVRIDAGGEKIFVVDDSGEMIDGMVLLAAVASLVLRARNGGTIAVPVTAPSIFEEIARRHGGAVVRTKVNQHALMAAATRDGVVLVGDGEGGMIFPQFQPAMDGLFATAKIVELLSGEGVRLAEVIHSLPEYFMSQGRVPCPWEAKGRVMRLLNDQYREQRTRQIDGVRIEMGKEWVLVLPDPDRPLFHVFAESTSREGARALMDKYTSLVSGLQQ